MNDKQTFLIIGLGNPGAEYARTRHNAGFMAVDALAGAAAVWKKEKNALTTRGVLPPVKDIALAREKDVASPPQSASLTAPPNGGGTKKSALLTAIPLWGGHAPHRPVIFVKPQTFMNNSGAAVQALMSFYKIPIENLIVIHDDMDLPLGKLREKVGGGSAGHNGIKSIDAAVGNNYRRIRMGIGRPGGGRISPTLGDCCREATGGGYKQDSAPPRQASPDTPLPKGGGCDFQLSRINPIDWVLGKFSDEELKKIKSVVEAIRIL